MEKKKDDQPADEPANEVVITPQDGTEATITSGDQPADEPANEVVITLQDGTEATITSGDLGDGGVITYTVMVGGEQVFMVESSRGLDDLVASMT